MKTAQNHFKVGQTKCMGKMDMAHSDAKSHRLFNCNLLQLTAAGFFLGGWGAVSPPNGIQLFVLELYLYQKCDFLK